MNALRANADPAFREMMAATLEGSGKPSPAAGVIGSPPLAAPAGLLLQAFLRRDAEVREALTALNAGKRPRQAWRSPRASRLVPLLRQEHHTWPS